MDINTAKFSIDYNDEKMEVSISGTPMNLCAAIAMACGQNPMIYELLKDAVETHEKFEALKNGN